MLNERNIPLEEDGIEEEILVDEEVAITKAMWGDIGGNIENQTDLQNALDAKQDSLTEAQLNAVNSGITSEKVTTYDGYADQIASKANQSALNAEATTREQADTALGRRIDDEATARQNADNGLQSQIDAITSKSDVVDVVANYAALQAYDTSSLGNNDVIKVLDDETHEDALTYYRWSTEIQTWTYIGQEAPYYSKGQMDVMLQGKQDKLTAGDNIQIENGTISATDTTYTAGNGLNLNGTEFSADTDVLATKEDLDDYYTKPETDNLLAPKLEAEVVAELPTTGEEGKLYLTPKAHTTQTATGNPITATVAEDAGAIESFQLDGDTFQQTYEGKNLASIDDTSVTTGTITSTISNHTHFEVSAGTPESWGFNLVATRQQIEPIPAGTYTFSLTRALPFATNLQLRSTGSGSSLIGTVNIPAGTTSVTFTLTESASIMTFWSTATASSAVSFDIQIESGSTATSYEPYVGGQPSPNPDYPQPIQTVTGTQTISINGTDYLLNLDTIELCRLDTYRDYIWKDGEDWKVHKATVKAELNGTEAWNNSSPSAAHPFYVANIFDKIGASVQAINAGEAYFSHFSITGQILGGNEYIGACLLVDNPLSLANVRVRLSDMSSGLESFKTMLSDKKPVIYAKKATATDTVITDTTLIAQLEAIRTASLENGTNTITNTAAGSNLAGDMEIGYYGYNPRNRYDKWLWLDINNEYEQIGS